MGDLTGGGSSKVEAKEYKTTAMEIFVDAAFDLHKWHSDLPELYSEVTEQNEDQTFAKQQLGSTDGGGRTIIGLRFCLRRWKVLRGYTSKNSKNLRPTWSCITAHAE